MAQVVAESSGSYSDVQSSLARPHHASSLIFPKFGFQDVFTDQELSRFAHSDIVDLMWAFLISPGCSKKWQE